MVDSFLCQVFMMSSACDHLRIVGKILYFNYLCGSCVYYIMYSFACMARIQVTIIQMIEDL